MGRIAFLLLLLTAPVHAAVDPARIDAALQKAKDFLYKQQSDDNWEKGLSDTHGDQKTGQTALVVYALLSAGEAHTDARITKAIEYLKKNDTTGVYALGIRCQVWLLLPQSPDVKRMMLKDSGLLRTSVITDGDGKGFYAYNPGVKAWSRSRAQYAVLGMWAAAQAGVEVPAGYWQLVEKSWIDSQRPDGGWNYSDYQKREYPITPGMTAVGVASLYITQDYFGAARPGASNPPIDKGMKWMVDHFDKVATDEQYDRDNPYATLYAVERIGVASGLKRFGTIDWYEKGAVWLLGKQLGTGAWPSEYGSNLHSTGFALLFLARGRAPIAMSKLDYTPENSKKPVNWNQRPRDAANVSRWAGRQLERDFNWQIVDLASPQDWHDAPVLYVSGSEDLALDASSKQKLKSYIEQGGMVLGNADGQSRAFAAAFRKLGQELFPSYEFRELPAEHVIYTNQQFPRARWKAKPSVIALSNGVRELMILLPQGDPGKSWQTLNVAQHEEHWQLASDILLYCADEKNLRKRGESYQVMRNESVKADRSIKLARLKYPGNWDPEPGGWRRLANMLHNRNKIDLEVVETDLKTGSLEGVKLAHLTGTSRHKLDDASRAKLKAFIDAGATLVIDAAGGSSEFASSMEEELAAILPGTTLAAIPKDHALFSAGGTAMKSFTYRPYAARILGSLKDEPRLRGIESNGRLAVIFSREDLSAGMVGQSVDGIVGYSPSTATEIISRVVLSIPK